MRDVSEYLAVYLGDPGTVPGIGSERGKKPTSGVGRYKSPHGSVRYVWYEHGTPLAALRVGRPAEAKAFVRSGECLSKNSRRRRSGAVSTESADVAANCLRLQRAGRIARPGELPRLNDSGALSRSIYRRIHHHRAIVHHLHLDEG